MVLQAVLFMGHINVRAGDPRLQLKSVSIVSLSEVYLTIISLLCFSVKVIAMLHFMHGNSRICFHNLLADESRDRRQLKLL